MYLIYYIIVLYAGKRFIGECTEDTHFCANVWDRDFIQLRERRLELLNMLNPFLVLKLIYVHCTACIFIRRFVFYYRKDLILFISKFSKPRKHKHT